MNNLSIPLLPKSIAVGLHDNLIQYAIELKFLLLFFDKPLAILSNTGMNYISSETVEAVRKGKKAKASAFDELNLDHLEYLGTEEWQELMNECEPLYRETIITVSNDLPDEKQFADVDKVFSNSSTLGQFTTPQLIELSHKSSKKLEEELDDLMREIFVRLEMLRLIDVLETCRKRCIPMVWGVDADLVIVNLYTEHLLEKFVSNSKDNEIKMMMRLLKGTELLKEISKLDIVNLATVPVSKIIDFRKSNSDLLHSFLTKYRGFLVEVQNDPMKADELAQSRMQDLAMEMETLRKELLLLRQEKKYNWLRRISESAYEGAKVGALASIWSLLFNPILLAGALGEMLVKAATNFTGDLATEKEKENALLFRSSSGYLWKAHENFKD